MKTVTDSMTGEDRFVLHAGEQRVYDVLISSGWSNKKIAEELGITEGTVKVHLTMLYRYFRVKERGELIASALWPRIHGLEKENRLLRDELIRTTEALEKLKETKGRAA